MLLQLFSIVVIIRCLKHIRFPPPHSILPVSPQRLFHSSPQSFPAAGFTPTPPPVPPLPTTSTSFPSSFPTSKITFRHSNPPLLSSSAALLFDQWHRSTSPPNPFLEEPNIVPLVSQGHQGSTLPSVTNVSRSASLFLSPPQPQNVSSSLPSNYSLFPQMSTPFLSPPLHRSSVSAPRPASSLSYITPSEAPVGLSSPSPSSYNPWGAVQVNIATVEMPPSVKTDPWGMALPNGGSETPKQPDPWGSPASGPPSRVTSPPTTSDPWGPPPARSPEPPMGGICGNDPWAVLGIIPPAKSSTPPVVGTNDPWDPVPAKPQTKDPFAPISPTNNGDVDEFSALSIRDKPANRASPLNSTNNSNSSFINNNLNTTTTTTTTNPFATPGLAPSSFAGVNPFSAPSPPNPFQAQQAPKPSMNQLRSTGIVGLPPSNAGAPAHTTGSSPGPWGSPQPSIGFGMAPAAASQDENPFLL
ncbi:epsin-1 isoform X3 [Procambarus clarkii]|uniref:epsin-1 isoform X3 n=1 Tax=Procambarus clarkii TaxID=6728 RepID=UPI0037422924